MEYSFNLEKTITIISYEIQIQSHNEITWQDIEDNMPLISEKIIGYIQDWLNGEEISKLNYQDLIMYIADELKREILNARDDTTNS